MVDLKAYFNQKAIQFGPTHYAVGWYSKETQYKRYTRILSHLSIEKGSLLDVGCGIGDFYDALIRSSFSYHYTGLDCSEEMISLAKKAYPKAMFLCQDVDHHHDVYDVVVSCGAFNIHQGTDHLAYLKEKIEHLLKLTRQTCIISLLSNKSDIKHDRFYYACPNELKTLFSTDQKLRIDEGYLLQDMLLIFQK